MESQRLQATFVSFALEAESDEKRGDVIGLLLETAAHLVAIQSFHGLMVINSALLCHSVYRLKNSWLIAESLAPSVKKALLDYTGVGGTRLMKRMVRHLKPSLSTLSEYLIFLPSDTMLLGGGEDMTFSLDSSSRGSEVRFSSDVSENSDYNNYRFGLSRNSSLKISFSEMEETQQKREQRRKGEIGYKTWMGSKYLSKIKNSFSRSRSRGSGDEKNNNRIEEESSSHNFDEEEEEEEEQDLSSMGIGERALYEQNQKQKQQKKRLRFFNF